MPSLIDPTTTVWTDEGRAIALDVLAKIALCEQQGARLGSIFEAMTTAKKNISTEAVCFSTDGNVYLVERPSKKENPSEPYPEFLHNPGVTHGAYETDEAALERLCQREFGGIRPRGIYFLRKRNAQDPPRGLYLLLIHALIFADGTAMKNPRGQFYRQAEIPWDRLVPSHRDIILPEALKWWGSPAMYKG